MFHGYGNGWCILLEYHGYIGMVGALYWCAIDMGMVGVDMGMVGVIYWCWCAIDMGMVGALY